MRAEKKSLPQNSKSHRKVRRLRIFLIIVGILIAIRLILPAVILHYANKELAHIDGYFGHINDIDLSLYRGAYQIDGIYIDKIDSASHKQIRFFASNLIDLSIEWRALLHGSLVGKMVFDFPSLYFTKDKAELGQVKKDTTTFRQILDAYMPLKVNRIEVINGMLHYTDSTKQPVVDLNLKDANIIAENLSSVVDKKITLPSTVTAQANAYDGKLNLLMKLNALEDNPTFDLNAEVRNTNLVLMNNFLKAYGNFDVHRGTFGLYSEMAARNGKFKGYVKPIINNLDVVGPEDRHDSFFQKAYEILIGGVGVVFRNQSKNQIATKINMEGDFNNPKTDKLEAIWEILKNAFIQALLPSIDNQITLKSVGASIKAHKSKGIFGKKNSSEDHPSKNKH